MSTEHQKPQHIDESVEVVIEKRTRSYSFGEPRVGSGLMALAANPNTVISALQTRIGGTSLLGSDKIAIRGVIEAFETVAPANVLTTYGQYTLDPYTSIQDGQPLVVDQAATQKWMNSPAFASISKANQGPLAIADFNVVLTDEKTASATYSIVQGPLHAASAAILVKTAKGWQIAVHCQHPVAG